MAEGLAAQPVMKEQAKAQAEALRARIIRELPDGSDWLKTPHLMLSGRTPDQALQDGDVAAVDQLVSSILYIGAT